MKRLIVYAAKCVTTILIAFLLAQLLHYNDYIWCLISAILVLSPDGKDALTLAMARLKANFIGAGAGLIMLLLHPMTVIMVAGAAAITVVTCYFAKLENPTRSALAASLGKFGGPPLVGALAPDPLPWPARLVGPPAA